MGLEGAKPVFNGIISYVDQKYLRTMKKNKKQGIEAFGNGFAQPHPLCDLSTR
jgi:mannitol/fructose-specific phosphotransferase system IIA component